MIFEQDDTTSPQDNRRIDVNEPYQMAYWSKQLGVTTMRLRDIVAQVGPLLRNVRKALQQMN